MGDFNMEINPTTLGFIFTSIISLGAVVVAVREIKRSIGKWILELIHEQNSTIAAKLEPVKHELSHNSGTSVKDRVDQILVKLDDLRREGKETAARVDKIGVQQEFINDQVRAVTNRFDRHLEKELDRRDEKS